MSQQKTNHHKVKDKGGPLAGQEIVFDAPDFVLSEFMASPNAELFVRKAYVAAINRIASEIKAKSNGTVPADLSSYEMIIARCLKFTKAQIRAWLDTRDWKRLQDRKDPEGIKASLYEWLPSLATRANFLGPEASRVIALKIVADLAIKPDPVADYMFCMLTVQRPAEQVELIDF